MIDFIKFQAIKSAEGHEACIKQQVYAMIETASGYVVFGTNKMLNEVKECPRVVENCVSGEGYHLCKEVCGQIAHAEVDAINNAKNNGYNLVNAQLTLVGHTYCCDNCIKEMKAVGIKTVHILDDNGKIEKHMNLRD